jgi:heat shock protein HslJ
MAIKIFSVIFFTLSLSLSFSSFSQPLRPGFDAEEYRELLTLSVQFGDSAYRRTLKPAEGYHHVYRSPVMGLENRWDLWAGKDRAVISIRGTTSTEVSWMANFYAAMVSARGELQLSDSVKFSYDLASHPRAGVHAGWLIGMAFLSRDILPKIDSAYRQGTRNMVILGHSQGAAIAFLLTAYCYRLQTEQKLPSDIRFKTYCSAGPKPGNLYFAYEYEYMTRDGWAFNVVNSADWVPETPISLQTLNDFNPTNPFIQARTLIGKQKFPRNLALRHVYNRLDKPTRKAHKTYQKYLGKMVGKLASKHLKGYSAPEYLNSSHYARTGNTIVLWADEFYYKLYPEDPERVFRHHFHQPYLYLASRLNLAAPDVPGQELAGTWELRMISEKDISTIGYYPGEKPRLVFELGKNRVVGFTGCNSMSGIARLVEKSMSFQALATTKKFCPGDGEKVFLEWMKLVDRYEVLGNELVLYVGKQELLRFGRKMRNEK